MKIKIDDLKIIWFFFRKYKLHGFFVSLFMLFSGFLEMLNLAALYPIINYGLSIEKKNFVLEKFEMMTQQIAPDNPLLTSCIVLVVISILALMFKFAYNYLTNKLLIRIMGDTQKRVLDKYMAADYEFYVKSQQGEMIYAGTTAPEKTTVTVMHTLNLGYFLINAIFLFSLLVILSWQATAIIMIIGYFYMLGIRNITRRLIHKCAQIEVAQRQRKNVILNEFITGFKTIKIYLASLEWKGRHVQAVDKGLRSRFRMLMGKILPEMIIKFLFYILIALTGIYFSQKSTAEMVALLPALGTFALVANRFLPSLHTIGGSVMNITESLPDARIVYNLCQKEFKSAAGGKIDLNRFNERIAFENVWFKYETSNDYLLKDLSFSIEKKKMTAIVGLSGAGKTTIINLLLKLYCADKGAITIDGTNILELSNKTYLSRFGYVSQETFIFNKSIKENIRFGMNDCTDEMIEEAAKLANADDFIRETTEGYETLVGDSGIKLSGGQRQRIAIARAMLRKPKIIILDEATSSLDNISEKKIQAAINQISKHTTVLVIAHRLSTVQNANKIIILQKGDIKEQGTHEELLKNKKLYYDLYKTKEVNEQDINESVKNSV